MASQRRECPKCRANMDEGFMLDHTYGGYGVPTFVLGPLRKKWWGFQLKGQTKLNVITYRCSRCGFLESYTGEQR